MDNGVTVLDNILDESMLSYCKNKIIELDSEFKKYETHFWFHNKLGSHTEFRGKKINDNYLEEAKIYNSILWDNFKNVYQTIADKLSEHFKINCVYNQNIFLPGIRTFVPKVLGVMNDNADFFHYDYNIYIVDWKKILDKNITDTISVTVAIEVPDYSYFDYINGTQTNDPNIYSINPTREQSEKMMDRCVSILCKEGSATCQWNHTIHRMGKLKFSNLNQRRTSIQISGVYDGEKLWLTW